MTNQEKVLDLLRIATKVVLTSEYNLQKSYRNIFYIDDKKVSFSEYRSPYGLTYAVDPEFSFGLSGEDGWFYDSCLVSVEDLLWEEREEILKDLIEKEFKYFYKFQA